MDHEKAEEALVVAEEAADLEEITSIADQEKCIKQFVLNVKKNAKYLLSQPKVDQSTVKNVFKKTILDNFC
jgi:hypothetical protein